MNGKFNTSGIVVLIVLSQFACTSLWFAGNAVIGDIIKEYGLNPDMMGHVVTAVQLGFVTGTLVFSLFTISDRYSPSKVFFLAALLGAAANLLVFTAGSIQGIIVSRYITGFCLAGIYPVGMKIASDYHEKGLGRALGFLVGALVLGTAFPHLLKTIGASLPWRYLMLAVSAMAIAGGTLVLLFIPDGPYRIKAGKPDFTLLFKLFRNKDLRSAAFGYFGHMWELYTFWAFVPFIVATYNNNHTGVKLDIPLLSFCVIAVGCLSCIAGGYISLKAGNARVAATCLAISLLCCVFSPFLYQLPEWIFILLMMVWGISVIADSPQFTGLIANAAAPAERGTALTIANTIGFFITIVSIQSVNYLCVHIQEEYLLLILVPGPLFGLLAFKRMLKAKMV